LGGLAKSPSGDGAIRFVPLPTDETPATCGKYLTSPMVQPFVGRWNMPQVLFDLIPMARDWLL